MGGKIFPRTQTKKDCKDLMRKCLKKNRITENFSDALGVPLLGKGLQVHIRHSEVCEQGRCLCHAESNDG
jgi:hypothetical protein